ncbi:7129_t:CDS:2, partial [Dentiscutata erythropus]
ISRSNSNISTTSSVNDSSYKASTSSIIDKLYIEEEIKKSRAYKNLIESNIEFLIGQVKKFIVKRAEKFLAESDEPVLQSGCYGYTNLFVLLEGGDCVVLELKYINLASFMKGSTSKFIEQYRAKELNELDKSLHNKSKATFLAR